MWCAKCGHRPRPEYGYRCRLHAEKYENAHTRPVAPSPPTGEEEMSTAEWVTAMEAFGDAMAAHKRAMDLWEPQWVTEGMKRPLSAPLECYPLPCVRCAGQTALGGAPSTAFEVSLEGLLANTPWLDSAYASGTPAHFSTSAGQFGTCVRCQLVVSIVVGDEEPP